MTSPPLIELSNVRKTYNAGTSAAVEVLRGVSLSIRAGEFIAIMGQSGSGKSTLMNILGLLDRPTSGNYRIAGRDILALDRDGLSALRRETFGFVFQQYSLISSISAVENVEVPAAYAGQTVADRRRHSSDLLHKLGPGDRLFHRPNELSGGQQQRVSIARALINGGQVILADEPTGALDTVSGAQVMDLLTGLADAGHTVILITHDPTVAARASRILEIRDGTIVAETSGRAGSTGKVELTVANFGSGVTSPPSNKGALLTDIREALRSGGRSLLANPVRTSLTLLGIVVGISSVIALLAIGEGAKHSVMSELSTFGGNRLIVSPGGENSRGPGGQLTTTDVDLIKEIPNVVSAIPNIGGNVTVRAGNIDVTAQATAASAEFPLVMGWGVAEGVFFEASDDRSLAAVAVIGPQLGKRLFPDGTNPIKRTILVNNAQFQVIGILASRASFMGPNNQDEAIVFPLSTGRSRVFGRQDLSTIQILIGDPALTAETSDSIKATLKAAHRVEDFRLSNPSTELATLGSILNILTLLLSGTAAISLFVGGIGVMNVMLMTVTERTREIGIRMAVGARTRDILRQFLIEAMIVSGAGGVVGVVLGIAIAAAEAYLIGIPVIFTATAICIAVSCAILTGLVFGFMPAHRAARLDPVAALSRE